MEKLIPQAPFEAMPQFMLLLLLAASIWILIKGAYLLVEGAAGLTYRLGIPKIIVGATIVSLGTTSPEAAVSVMAAWEGKPGLALGNAVGSIITDTGLIFGLGCILTMLPADRFVLKRQGWVDIACGFLLAALCYGMWFAQGKNATLGQEVGIVLLVLLALYLCVSIRWSRIHPLGDPFVTSEGEQSTVDGELSATAPNKAIDGRTALGLLAITVLGLALVVFSSRFVIGSVTVLAQQWAISEVVIAATLVALGTSLPELVVGVTAIRRGHPELLVGNIIGADILNVLFVIGASAVATPLAIIDAKAKIPEIFLYLHLPAMLTIMILFLIYILIAVRRGHFERWFGAPLLGMYALYLTLLLLFGQTT